MNAQHKYECGTCLEVYTGQGDAFHCCPNEVNDVYFCSECKEPHYDQDEANECCQEGDDQ